MKTPFRAALQVRDTRRTTKDTHFDTFPKKTGKNEFFDILKKSEWKWAMRERVKGLFCPGNLQFGKSQIFWQSMLVPVLFFTQLGFDFSGLFFDSSFLVFYKKN